MLKNFIRNSKGLCIIFFVFINAFFMCTKIKTTKIRTYENLNAAKKIAENGFFDQKYSGDRELKKTEDEKTLKEEDDEDNEDDENKLTLPKFVYEFTSFARSNFFRDSIYVWKKHCPYVKDIRIKSSLDSKMQQALFYDSGSERKKPLLVVLHSWSSNYEQTGDIPYAEFAKVNDWVFIHPNFRGINKTPQATCSELAVRDVLDALEYAKKTANVDTSRIYLTGFSGGAMMCLVLAGRFPELWTAVVAWVPVLDLRSFYWYTKYFSRKHYISHIITSCGGRPDSNDDVYAEYLKRSPVSYLKNARGKPLKIYIVSGIKDSFVPPSHALKAYNLLVDEKDSIPYKYIQYIDQNRSLPKELLNKDKSRNPLIGHSQKKLLFSRNSGLVSVYIFDGGHDMAYNVGLYWLSLHEKEIGDD